MKKGMNEGGERGEGGNCRRFPIRRHNGLHTINSENISFPLPGTRRSPRLSVASGVARKRTLSPEGNVEDRPHASGKDPLFTSF